MCGSTWYFSKEKVISADVGLFVRPLWGTQHMGHLKVCYYRNGFDVVMAGEARIPVIG